MLSLLIFSFLVNAEDELNEPKQIHTHVEKGVVYCDVVAFNHEAYFLKVLGGGSPLTVYWQFQVLKKRPYWLNQVVVNVRLGRQVIPDLVTKRWLMRDLSSGVVRYTSDIEIAMRFLSDMDHIAVVDVSVLDIKESYALAATLHTHEGKLEQSVGLAALVDWGEEIGLAAIEWMPEAEPAHD